MILNASSLVALYIIKKRSLDPTLKTYVKILKTVQKIANNVLCRKMFLNQPTELNQLFIKHCHKYMGLFNVYL